MGLFSRLFRAPPIRSFHTSPAPPDDLSGNVSVPGSLGFTQTHTNPMTGTPSQVDTVVPGPRVAPNLHTAESYDPARVHVQYDALQPHIPVREPTGMPGPQEFYTDNRISPATVKQRLADVPAMPLQIAKAPTQIRSKTAGNNSAVTYMGSTVWDGADPAILRKQQAHTPMAEHFRQFKELPAIPITVPASGVFVPPLYYQRGWYQAFIPEPGMRLSQVGDAPPVHLSRPIHVSTVVSAMVPLRGGKAAKAPPRQRTRG